MWYKLLIIILLVAGIGYLIKSGEEKISAMPQSVAKTEISKIATNIVLREYNATTHATTRIEAKTAIQKTDDSYIFNSFNLSGKDSIVVKGKEADYNTKDNILKISGDVYLETTSGINGTFSDLEWNRKANVAFTDKPLKIYANGGLIESRAARFSDNFDNLEFKGGIHAVITKNPTKN